jgi:hypothetical protein
MAACHYESGWRKPWSDHKVVIVLKCSCHVGFPLARTMTNSTRMLVGFPLARIITNSTRMLFGYLKCFCSVSLRNHIHTLLSQKWKWTLERFPGLDESLLLGNPQQNMIIWNRLANWMRCILWLSGISLQFEWYARYIPCWLHIFQMPFKTVLWNQQRLSRYWGLSRKDMTYNRKN